MVLRELIGTFARREIVKWPDILLFFKHSSKSRFIIINETYWRVQLTGLNFFFFFKSQRVVFQKIFKKQVTIRVVFLIPLKSAKPFGRRRRNYESRVGFFSSPRKHNT